jgi:hypothetical protein
MKTAFSLLLLLVVTMTAASALAAPPDAEKQAEALVAQAKERYQAGDYEHAAQLYMKAYGEVQRPAPVFNAARAYEQAGLWAEAKPLFELYIQIDRGDDADSVAGRADAAKHLAGVNAKIAEETARRNAPPPVKVVTADPPPKITPPPVKQSPVIQDPPPADPPKNVAAVKWAAPPEDRWSGQKTAAVVTMAAGGVLILTSIVVGIVAHNQLADLDARLAGDQIGNSQNLTLHGSVTQVEMDSGIATYNARQVTAGVLGGVGAAAVVAGGILWWNDSGKTPNRVGLTTGVVPNQGGALWTLAGHF